MSKENTGIVTGVYPGASRLDAFRGYGSPGGSGSAARFCAGDGGVVWGVALCPSEELSAVVGQYGLDLNAKGFVEGRHAVVLPNPRRFFA